MREQIIKLAKKCDADIVGFAPASRFDKNDAVFKIFPETKTVIGLGFRVLRGIYRGIEEGSTYYQYTTMGVENLEELQELYYLDAKKEAYKESYYDSNLNDSLLQDAINIKTTY